MFKQNDIVWIDESRLARADDAPFGVALTHLTVAEAFGLAGLEPNGKLVCSGQYWYSGNSYLSEERCVWVIAQMPYTLPDLSRTPVSDCWDALPQVVREAVEKKLEEGNGK